MTGTLGQFRIANECSEVPMQAVALLIKKAGHVQEIVFFFATPPPNGHSWPLGGGAWNRTRIFDFQVDAFLKSPGRTSLLVHKAQSLAPVFKIGWGMARDSWVRKTGLEPATFWLGARCTTIVLSSLKTPVRPSPDFFPFFAQRPRCTSLPLDGEP